MCATPSLKKWTGLHYTNCLSMRRQAGGNPCVIAGVTRHIPEQSIQDGGSNKYYCRAIDDMHAQVALASEAVAQGSCALEVREF